MPKTESVLVLDPEQITVGWRARVELRAIDDLASSIEECGQLQPIAVAKNGSGYELIAGHRRLEACRQLCQPVKAIVVKAVDEADAIWKQLTENVQRSDFTKLELGEGLRKHKAVYEKLHPGTKLGATGGGKGGKGTKSKADFASEAKPVDRFTKQASGDLGISERSIQRAVQLAEELTPQQKKAIHEIADPAKRSRAEMQALSSLAKKRKETALEKRAQVRQAARPKSDGSRFDLGDNVPVLAAYAAEGLCFDLCLTDPPYELDWSQITHSVRGDLNAAPTWDDLDVGWIFKVVPVLAESATVIAFCPGEAIGTYQEAFHEARLEYRGFVVWHKNNPAPQHRPGYISSVECMVWATRGTPYFKPWHNAGSRDAHNMIEVPVCGGNERLAHPAQKPIALLDRLLERHAHKGDLVLDPFAGVASTLVAAKARKLIAYGIERDEKYFKLGMDRIRAL
jgi:DNA modification methylase/ParB-like chromosome segregation protein Spo0J